MTGTSQKTPKRWVIDRPRLVDLIEDVLTRRLTTVIAGPGFGKSTLLASPVFLWQDDGVLSQVKTVLIN